MFELSPSALLLVFAGLLGSGCKRAYAVGDHVLVEWDGKDYPAFVKAAPGPNRFRVHYDGYDDIWDEDVSRDRIRRVIDGPVIAPEPPAKVRAKAMQAAQKNLYKIGDKIRVEWHGQMYLAKITGIVGQERYRIQYEGYGTEWDETVGLSRIQQK